MNTPANVWQLILALFRGKDTFRCFTFVLIQQIIVASSTVFIILLGKSIAEHNIAVMYLLFFILSLMVVYLPGVYSLIYLEKAKFGAFKKYISIFSESNKNYTSLLNNREYRKKNDPWLTNESFLVMNETSALFYEWISSGLNAFLNILVIGLVIEPMLFFAYIISFSLLYASVKISKNNIESSAVNFQKDRNLMNQSLLSGVDNILVANDKNLGLWTASFDKNINNTIKSAVSLTKKTNLYSSITMILALIPIAFVTLLFFYKNINNYALLTTLVVTLPRQIQIIQNIFSVFSHAMHWHGVRGKLKGLLRALSPMTDKTMDLRSKIKWDSLEIKYNNKRQDVNGLEDFLKFLSPLKSGRITMRAPNGSGKSVLFSLLKESLKNKAYLLPTSSDLIFESTSNKSVSHGEKTILILDEIHKDVHSKVLLLDEWDANLDIKNREIISEKINSMSNNTVIVETRHNTSD
jgi:hypothetical protein